uniref:Putative secreted peptide n=1 Tax=Anopheles braziliensis TaxID=58242 RepID=A0A2M3ZWC2_9DIPT
MWKPWSIIANANRVHAAWQSLAGFGAGANRASVCRRRTASNCFTRLRLDQCLTLAQQALRLRGASQRSIHIPPLLFSQYSRDNVY